MANLQCILSTIVRRSQSIATAESAAAPTTTKSVAGAAAAMRRSRASESSHEAEEATVQNFWMRDPKSGNWIPENHFADVDAADLRAKLLSKK